jgi:hypothetical protein
VVWIGVQVVEVLFCLWDIVGKMGEETGEIIRIVDCNVTTD